MANGNAPMSSFGRSNASIWNGEGELKKPVVTATTRSAMPNRFQARTKPVGSTPLPRDGDAHDWRKQTDQNIAAAGRQRKRARQPSFGIEHQKNQAECSIDLDAHDPLLRRGINDAPQ